MLRYKHYLDLIAVAGIVPFCYVAFPFLCGFCNLSQGYLMLSTLLILVGPIFAGIVFGMTLKTMRLPSRIGLGILVWILGVGSFFLFPPGAKTWTLGFSTNFILTKKPTKMQQWAVGILTLIRLNLMALMQRNA